MFIQFMANTFDNKHGIFTMYCVLFFRGLQTRWSMLILNASKFKFNVHRNYFESFILHDLLVVIFSTVGNGLSFAILRLIKTFGCIISMETLVNLAGIIYSGVV